MVEMLRMSWLRFGFRSHLSETHSLADFARQIKSLFTNALSYDNAETSLMENRNALIAIQWFVAIGTSYLILSSRVGAGTLHRSD
jgi:hypothetical protein